MWVATEYQRAIRRLRQARPDLRGLVDTMMVPVQRSPMSGEVCAALAIVVRDVPVSILVQMTS